MHCIAAAAAAAVEVSHTIEPLLRVFSRLNYLTHDNGPQPRTPAGQPALVVSSVKRAGAGRAKLLAAALLRIEAPTKRQLDQYRLQGTQSDNDL